LLLEHFKIKILKIIIKLFTNLTFSFFVFKGMVLGRTTLVGRLEGALDFLTGSLTVEFGREKLVGGRILT
jgi:hypothetical protein